MKPIYKSDQIPIFDEFELENLKFMSAVEKGITYMRNWDGKLSSIRGVLVSGSDLSHFTKIAGRDEFETMFRYGLYNHMSLPSNMINKKIDENDFRYLLGQKYD